MATIAINGTTLQPQPADSTWEDSVTGGNLNGTDSLGAYKLLRLISPSLAGQAYNWNLFDNQDLISVQAYDPEDLPTGANVVFSAGAVSRKITRYESPLDNSINGVELIIQVIPEAGS
jgi:hypothetical protein